MVRFIEYFKIGVVIINNYKNPTIQFNKSKYFVSDFNFHVAKKKHMFLNCDYFIIIGYFDNIHFDLFYNQETKKLYTQLNMAKKGILFGNHVMSKIAFISLEKK